MVLKNELKSIRKELEKMSDNQEAEIYFVETIAGDYIVKTADNGTVIFQGDEREYREFTEKHHKSYFIKFNIPRPNYDSLYD